MSNEVKKPSANEGIKTRSRFLRGTIAEGLQDTSTGALCHDDQVLLKFHGSYQQDDRDLRAARRKFKLEPAYIFMVRIRLTGGILNSSQWLTVDRIATDYGNGDFKLSTRQAIQLHGIIKNNLKSTMRDINLAAMNTLAACGDVNRNVMCNPNPFQSAAHEEVINTANAVMRHLAPRTGAYHEIWLDQEKIISSEETEEPIYGKTYLPRKFKIGFAIPPHNDIDLFANDLGFIAIVEDGKLVGYNVAAGGGMGMTHGDEETFPHIATVFGFCTPDQVVDVAEKALMVQRDFGDRSLRKHARLKYTIADRSIEWFRDEVNNYLGYKLEPARPYHFETNGDQYGWVVSENGYSHFTMYVAGGRVIDKPGFALRTGLREIAKIHDGDFRLTGNQNLIIANISPEKKAAITALMEEYGILRNHDKTGIELGSVACVALPTCGLALAESERYMPVLLEQLNDVVERAGLRHDSITIRSTGCPNGCARPYLSEIAMVGRGPNRYNLYLGGGHAGDRMNKLFRQDVQGEEIAGVLEPILFHYAREREEGEKFGDFVIRTGYVAKTIQGTDFHKNVGNVTGDKLEEPELVNA